MKCDELIEKIKKADDEYIKELNERHKQDLQALEKYWKNNCKNHERKAVEYAVNLCNKEKAYQKYKRCIGNAKWCYNQREIYERDSYNFELERDEVEALRNKADIMREWRKRWLKLAEDFKKEYEYGKRN